VKSRHGEKIVAQRVKPMELAAANSTAEAVIPINQK
jgi:hypothetical protein